MGDCLQFEAEQGITKLLDIEISVGKYGEQTPVAHSTIHCAEFQRVECQPPQTQGYGKEKTFASVIRSSS
jgi:hypothetical protein